MTSVLIWFFIIIIFIFLFQVSWSNHWNLSLLSLTHQHGSHVPTWNGPFVCSAFHPSYSQSQAPDPSWARQRAIQTEALLLLPRHHSGPAGGGEEEASCDPSSQPGKQVSSPSCRTGQCQRFNLSPCQHVRVTAQRALLLWWDEK